MEVPRASSQLIPDLYRVPGGLFGHRVTAGAQCFYNSLVGIGGQIPFRPIFYRAPNQWGNFPRKVE